MGENDRSRPGEKAAPMSNSGPASIPPPTDEPPGFAEWWVVHEAESNVYFELRAIAALRALSTNQLRSLVWVGLLDEGWTRLYAELAERGEEL